jgi:hypothetical protein
VAATTPAADNDDYSPLFAGQGLRLLKKGEQGAAEIVEMILSEATAVLSRLQEESDQTG